MYDIFIILAYFHILWQDMLEPPFCHCDAGFYCLPSGNCHTRCLNRAKVAYIMTMSLYDYEMELDSLLDVCRSFWCLIDEELKQVTNIYGNEGH